jgi:hypothetical protein
MVPVRADSNLLGQEFHRFRLQFFQVFSRIPASVLIQVMGEFNLVILRRQVAEGTESVLSYRSPSHHVTLADQLDDHVISDVLKLQKDLSIIFDIPCPE